MIIDAAPIRHRDLKCRFARILLDDGGFAVRFRSPRPHPGIFHSRRMQTFDHSLRQLARDLAWLRLIAAAGQALAIVAAVLWLKLPVPTLALFAGVAALVGRRRVRRVAHAAVVAAVGARSDRLFRVRHSGTRLRVVPDRRFVESVHQSADPSHRARGDGVADASCRHRHRAGGGGVRSAHRRLRAVACVASARCEFANSARI